MVLLYGPLVNYYLGWDMLSLKDPKFKGFVMSVELDLQSKDVECQNAICFLLRKSLSRWINL